MQSTGHAKVSIIGRVAMAIWQCHLESEMNSWVSCEACGTIGHASPDCPFGTIGHASPDCPFGSALSVDFDQAGRQLLAQPKAYHLHQHIKPLPADFSTAGQELLQRLGRITTGPEPSAANSEGGSCEEVAGEATLDVDEGCDTAQIMVERTGAMNLIWKPNDATGAGEVYVGGLQAATEKAELEQRNISHVVNCMNSPDYNVQQGVEYFNFAIERFETYRKKVMTMDTQGGEQVSEEELVTSFFEPAMSFIQNAVEGGGHVLIHCFAGAHRAGSTGVAFLMKMEHLRVEDAIATAQCLRPVIDPKAFGDLYTLLCVLERALFTEPNSIKPANMLEPDDSNIYVI